VPYEGRQPANRDEEGGRIERKGKENSRFRENSEKQGEGKGVGGSCYWGSQEFMKLGWVLVGGEGGI